MQRRQATSAINTLADGDAAIARSPSDTAPGFNLNLGPKPAFCALSVKHGKAKPSRSG
jgi:hypothetical protein